MMIRHEGKNHIKVDSTHRSHFLMEPRDLNCVCHLDKKIHARKRRAKTAETRQANKEKMTKGWIIFKIDVKCD